MTKFTEALNIQKCPAILGFRRIVTIFIHSFGYKKAKFLIPDIDTKQSHIELFTKQKTVKNLRSAKYLKLQTLTVLADEMEKRFDVTFDKSYITSHYNGKINIPEKRPNTRFHVLIVPVRIYNVYRHWGQLLIDYKKETVEFYDSIGAPIAAYKKTALFCSKRSSEMGLLSFFKETSKRLNIGDFNFEENTELHQHDLTNCAVYLFHRTFQRVVWKMSFEAAQKAPLSSQRAFKEEREFLASLFSS